MQRFHVCITTHWCLSPLKKRCLPLTEATAHTCSIKSFSENNLANFIGKDLHRSLFQVKFQENSLQLYQKRNSLATKLRVTTSALAGQLLFYWHSVCFPLKVLGFYLKEKVFPLDGKIWPIRKEKQFPTKRK